MVEVGRVRFRPPNHPYLRLILRLVLRLLCGAVQMGLHPTTTG